MDNWRTIGPHVSPSGKVRGGLRPRYKSIDCRFCHPPQLMTAWDHQQGTVVGWHVIEVNAERYHAIEKRLWRLNVQLALFEGPGTIPLKVKLLSDANCAVLVPTERPIGGFALIEENRPYREGGPADQCRSDDANWTVVAEQISNGSQLVSTHPDARSRR